MFGFFLEGVGYWCLCIDFGLHWRDTPRNSKSGGFQGFCAPEKESGLQGSSSARIVLRAWSVTTGLKERAELGLGSWMATNANEKLEPKFDLKVSLPGRFD